jgi:hypothetical protein
LFGEQGKYRAKYEKLALGYTGSKLSGAEFVRSLGREKDVTAEFQRWLLASQMPFEIGMGEWEEKPDGRIVGGSGYGDVVAAASLREPFKRLTCRVEGLKHPRTSSGVLLAWIDAKNYVFARFIPPFVASEWIKDGEQVDVQQWKLPNPAADSVVVELAIQEVKADPIKKRVNERPGLVTFDVDGKRIDVVHVPIGRLGLATLGGACDFTEVRWQ